MKAIFSLALFLFPLFLRAQDTLAAPRYFSFIADWSVGDSFLYDRIIGENRYQSGLLKDSSEQLDKLLWAVTETSDSTNVVRVFASGGLSSAYSKKNGIKRADMIEDDNHLDFMYLEFVTDADGSFIEFRHLDEMYEVYSALVDTSFARTLGDPKNWQDIRFAYDKLKSRSYFESFFLQEIPVMQKFYGVEYELDSIWEFNLPILNPFDPKDTINFPNVVLATMPADWGGLVRLENSFNLKGEDAKAYALSLFSGSNNPEQKFADIFGSKPLAFEYYISYAIFPDTGVIDSMYLTMSYFSGEEIFLQKYVKLILN